jgi:outer membrane protein assembly factor BamB
LYFDARLVSLDAATGARLWDVPLVGSLPSSTADDVGRGEARGLVASKARVYVTRSGGGLDVFDAADGRAIGTIGRL